MNLIRKTATLLAATILYASITFGQPSTALKVGEPLPEFKLSHVTHYAKSKVSNKDFKNKWLILDFWSSTCAPCIKNFPKINKLQGEFKDDVQFMLVGLNSFQGTGGSGKRIESLYEKLSKNMGLNLSSAYDSTLFRQWSIGVVPYYVVVNPKGIIWEMPSGEDLNPEHVRKLIHGEIPITQPKSLEAVPEFEISKFPGSENDRVIYRSILTKGYGQRVVRDNLKSFVNNDPQDRKDGLVFALQPLYRLYQSAYFAEMDEYKLSRESKYPKVVLELQDSSLFQSDYNTEKGLYNYNLAVPMSKSTDLTFIKKMFQRELENTFGYEVTIETRKMPVWKIIAKPGAADKLITTGGAPFWEGSYVGIKITNHPLETLVQHITYAHPYRYPFFDETDIKGNIDINFEGLITDFEQVRATLGNHGLELVLGKKEMEVLVIRDLSPSDAVK